MSSTTNLSLRDPAFAGKSLLAQALWIGAFAAGTALAARFEIPHQPVPFTLQTMVVLLAGAFLGPRNGALSQAAYVAAGIAGAPVFAGGAFGPAALIGPTGGYLMAFPLAAAIVGLLLRPGSGLLRIALAMALGLVAIFSAGTIHLYAFYLHDAQAAFTGGFLLFSGWDLLKLGAATMIYREVGKRWPQVP
jgi:biotin transport system substrate-specific component